MKNKLFAAIAAVMLVLSMALSVSAATDAFVYDEAGLLTRQEAAALNETLSRLSDTYDAQIVAATISSVHDGDVDAYVEYVYDTMGFGYGENLDGVLLLVCMEPREYRILSNGYAGVAIDSNTISNIGDAIVNDLTDGNYADAFEEFADQCAYYLDGYRNGFPFDHTTTLMVAVGLGLLVGVITATILKGQLKTVRRENRAQNYVKSGSMKVTEQRDTFLYRDVKKTRKNTDSSSGGSRSSGGSSRSIGGGSF